MRKRRHNPRRKYVIHGVQVMGVRTILATDEPIYDKFGPDDHWNADEWMAWHQAMVKTYGLEQANQKWCLAWLKGLSRVAGGFGEAPGSGEIFDSVPLGERTTNARFRTYLVQNPMLYNVVYSGMGGEVAKALAAAGKLGTATVKAAKKTAELVDKAGDWTKPILIALAVGAALYYLPKR